MYTTEQLNLITEWKESVAVLHRAKGNEAALRRKVLSAFCPEPQEGTNKVELPSGWKLNVKQPYSYKVDEAALDAMRQSLPPGTVDQLVRFKPELDKRAYKGLVEQHRNIFDEALIIKPGSPSLELVAPKE